MNFLLIIILRHHGEGILYGGQRWYDNDAWYSGFIDGSVLKDVYTMYRIYWNALPRNN